jgi:SNF2 family DNA or RNA helicase
VITTYEIVLNDASYLSKFDWAGVVVDEAHRLKNAASALATVLREQYRSEHTLLLTGTPVQNNLGELWALMHCLHPPVFDDKEAFTTRFADVAASATAAPPSSLSSQSSSPAPPSSATSALRSMLAHFLLRRLKSECDVGIAGKREVVVSVALTALQRKYYRAVLTRNAAALGAGNARGLVNVIASLRKACNHPYLFAGAEPEPFAEGDHLWQASGKFTVLHHLLRSLKRRNRRVILFSQSVHTLDVLQDYLAYQSFSYERLDGSVRAQERFEALGRFKSGNSGFCEFCVTFQKRKRPRTRNYMTCVT